MKTLRLLYSTLLLGLAACGEGPTPPPPPPAPTIDSVKISPTSTTLYPPQTQQHICTVYGRGNYNRAVTWSQDAPNGLFTASGLGAFTVTCTSAQDTTKGASATVTVTSGIDAVTISPKLDTVLVGGGARFTGTVVGPNPNHRGRWTTTLGSIDSTGLLTAPGTTGTGTVAFCSEADTVKCDSATIVVVTGITSIALTPEDTTATVSDSFLIHVTISGSNPNKGYVLTSSRGATIRNNWYLVPTTAGVDTVCARANADTTKMTCHRYTSALLNAPRLEWVRFLDLGGQRDDAFGVAVDNENNIYVGGIKWFLNSDPYGALASYDSRGNRRWVTELDFPSAIGPLVYLGNGLAFGGRAGGLSSSSPQTLCGNSTNSGFVTTRSFASAGVAVARSLGSDLFFGRVDGTLARTTSDCSLIEVDTLRAYSGLRGLWVTPDHLLVSGEFNDNEGSWNVAGYIRKLNADGSFAWERTYDDAIKMFVVEDAGGLIYVGGTQLPPGSPATGPYRLFVSALDQTGHELWRVSWDGDNPRADNQGNFSEDLILNPKGGVVLIAQITELAGNPNCTTPPNCWDFGAWAVNASGGTVWKLRQDFNRSSWDAPRRAAFDNAGNLIIVGGSVIDDSGDDFHDNRDWAIAKFRVP